MRVEFPSFLPDGRRFLYLVKRRDGSSTLMLGERGKPPQIVAKVESNAHYVEPGTLVFARGGALVGQPFDLGERPPSWRTLPHCRIRAVLHLHQRSPISQRRRAGPWCFRRTASLARVAWVDRGGRELSRLGPSADYTTVRISDHGRSALLSRALPATGAFDIWSFDVARGTETRLTQDDADHRIRRARVAGQPSLMFFGVARGGPPRLVRRDLRTGRDELLMPAGLHLQEAEDITPDGRLLVFTERTEGGLQPFLDAASAGDIRSIPTASIEGQRGQPALCAGRSALQLHLQRVGPL